MRAAPYWLLVLVLLGSAACLRPPPGISDHEPWTAQTALKAVSAPPLGLIEDAEALKSALGTSLDYYRALPPDAPFRYGPDLYLARELGDFLAEVLSRLEALGAGQEFTNYLAGAARFYESTAPRVLVTGYYEIRLDGSRTFSPEYPHPVYRKPPDLLRIPLKPFLPGAHRPELPELLRARLTGEMAAVPYHSRRDIDRLGALRDKGLEICWIRDPYRLFFLHIQGSGIVQFEDGSELNLNYADSNGHPYRSIGRTLIDGYGVDPNSLSMQGIYGFLKDNPLLADEVMDTNPSYVFFRVVDKGPIGSLGRPLTPKCSIATDSRLFPKGALALMEAELPQFDSLGKPKAWLPWRGLVLNQDTGGAIRGPGRVDWFIGSDEAGERTAGHLKQPGRLFFLAPRKR
jgi:membrane-bound lytic murein transglycosylase A